jgi:hypothetical protein
MFILNGLIAVALFALIGYLIGKNIPKPKRYKSSTVIIVGVILLVLAGHVGVSTRLVSIAGVEVMLNDALQGLLMGILIRLVRDQK